MLDKDTIRHLNQVRKDITEKQQALTALRATFKKRRTEATLWRRQAGLKARKASPIVAKYSAAMKEMGSIEKALAKTKEEYSASLAQIFPQEVTPQEAIKLFSDRKPILLLPVRIETKFRQDDTGKHQLWVRLYPDDVAIETHEPYLTEEELAEARLYWQRRDVIEASAEEDDRRAQREVAWRELLDRFGVFRAAYIVQLGREHVNNDNIPLKPEAWSEAPKSYVMPDFFVLRLYREKVGSGNGHHDVFEEHELIYEERGKPIPHPLVTGPDPFASDNDTSNVAGQEGEGLLFDEESEWLIDFEKAVDIGMALKIDLADEDLSKGFSRVVALGVKVSTDAQEGQNVLSNLINSQQYSEGFSFLKPGTPTNNTGQSGSGFSRKDDEVTPAFAEEHLGIRSLNGTDDAKTSLTHTDSAILADYLGIPPNIFQYVKHANLSGDKDAEHIQNALWPATWGYFLKNMLSGIISDENIEKTRQHYVKYVRPNGPLSAICVENMPYGILPVSSLSQWQFTDTDPQKDFLNGLHTILKKLYLKWYLMAKDPKLVPRVGATDDPDKELIEILGMEGGSYTCRIRPIATREYVMYLFAFLRREILANYNAKRGLVNQASDYFNNLSDRFWRATGQPDPIQQWHQRLSETLEDHAELLGEFTNYTGNPPILNVVSWGDGYDLDIPLVQDGPLLEGKPLKNNYIETLKNADYNQILHEEWGGDPPPETLLFCLLRLAILLERDLLSAESLPHLAGLSASKLERLLTETLDVSTHRLDAWITSLATRRLHNELRANDEEGLYLGAYGWVENLKPVGNKATSGGYIHAPSIPHAVTSAVLRNAHLTHTGPDNSSPMSVDLSSERVRQALWLLQGVQQGQTLGALLGYRFERSLHNLSLDQYIEPFRELYSLTIERTDEIPANTSVEAIAARNVVDGLKLVNAFRNKNIPFDTDDELPLPDTQHFSVLNEAIEATSDSFDALSDLALAESVYHSVTGNYLRAGALLDAISGDKGSVIEPDVAHTPRSGFNLKHNFIVLFTGNAQSETNNWAVTPRARAEPYLNAWAGKMLGDPDKVICRAWYPAPNASEGSYMNVKLSTLALAENEQEMPGLSPLDFVYLSTSLAKDEATELEQRIKYSVRKKNNLTKDIEIRIQFDRSDDFNPETTFSEILELARRILDIIGNAKYLSPVDLYLPEETEGTTNVGFCEDDYNALQARIKTDNTSIIDAYGTLKTIQSAFYDEENLTNDCDQLRSALMDASQFGIDNSIPTSANETDEQTLRELKSQAKSVLQEIEKRLKECDNCLEEAKAAKEAMLIVSPNQPDIAVDKAREAIAELSAAVKAIFGKSFTILPQFTPKNADELGQTLDETNTTNLLDGENKQSIITWFQQAAKTHPQLKQFETMMMLAEAYNSDSKFELRIGQLPFRENDRWLAFPFKENDERERTQGTVSLVANIPFNYLPNDKFAGLELDKWDESIPNETETTALVYQYNRPGTEAPQSLLLAVSPVISEQGGKWEWEHLVKCVEETINLTKIRAVDLDALTQVGQFLPALYMPGIELTDSQTTQLPIASRGLEK